MPVLPQSLSLNPLKDTVFPLISAGPQISAASNKRRTFGYPHRNKHLPLISASPLISDAHINVALIRIVMIFH